MITFTKEQLIASAHARIEFSEMMLAGELEPLKERTWSIELELARIALASLEADPIGFAFADDVDLMRKKIKVGRMLTVRHQGEVALYTAQPAPVSVPDLKPVGFLFVAEDGSVAYSPTDWPMEGFNLIGQIYGDLNAGRVDMLQGAYGNTPVIPDGWVMVPVEPTEDMIVNGFESEPDESFSDEEVWEAYDAMSGCQQAAHRAKLCWAAMIAAAPQQEVK
ncbi:hypothetical protein [Enterobacter hormaechei]|uniref:hypothetical protein n=1 Tax=Enterobacter hormaechei TaxID=158836 RepID=UPI001A9CA517|nr:hypothetical protein [Enterobacter hormaechei]